MSEPKRKRLVRKRKLEKWSGRGEIYAWLRAHHKKIKSLKVGDDRPWSELLLDLRMDLAGIIPAERIALNNVLNTWKRVCRDLGDSPPVYRFRNYPSRIPKDWRPEAFSSPAVGPAAGGQPTSASPSLGSSLIRTSPSENTVTGRKLTGKEKLARLEAELASRRGG
jgi:hypothetical protein